MSNNFDRIYIFSLYIIMGLLMAINAVSALSGAFIALIPLAFQSAIIFAVAHNKSWAPKAVIVWSAIVIIGGLSTWLAEILGETAPKQVLFLQSFGLIAGLFFAYFANSVFSRRVE